MKVRTRLHTAAVSILLFCGVVFGLSPQLCSAEDAVKGRGKLVAVDAQYNFGSVNQGAKVEHTFQLTNDGNAPVAIRKVQPSCGCTVSASDKQVVQPGEKASITATFDSAGYQGMKVIPIHVLTDDPRQTFVELTLKGSVRRDVEIEADKIAFGNVQRGSSVSRSVKVLAERSLGIKITDVSSRSDQVEVEVRDVADNGRNGKEIRARLKPTVPIGLFRSVIVVKTTSSETPVVNVPVFARVEGDLKFAPPDISFGLMEGPLEKRLTQSVELVNSGSAPVKILSVDSNNSSVLTEVKEVEAGKKYRVQVFLKEGFVGTLKAKIDIKTDHKDPEQATISLPVYGIVASS